MALTLPAALGGGRALAACQLGQLAQLPVTMVGLRPTIPIRINGAEATFMVDSGSFFSMMTPAAAEQFQLPLRAGPDRLQISGIGGPIAYRVGTVAHFGLGPVDLRRVDVIVGGNVMGGGAQGLLGQNLLEGEDVEYDLANGVIRLMREKGCGKANLAYWDHDKPYSMVEMEAEPALAGAHSIAYLNGKKIRVLFDTGSPLSLLSLRAARRAGFRTDAPGVIPGGLTAGLGRAVLPTWIAHFDSFRIGEEEIRNTRLRVADVGSGDIDMFIGADFFLAHHIYVANSQHRLYFTYNGGPVFNLTAYQRSPDEASGSRAPASQQPSSPQKAQALGAPQAPAPGAATAQNPDNAADLARQGAALDARGQYPAAIAALTRALALDPTNPGYFGQRGVYELHAKDRTQATADLDRALQLQPDDVSALLVRAQLRAVAGDKLGAAQDAAAADRSVPREAEARLRLGEIYLRLEQYDAAIRDFSFWLDSHPQDINAARVRNDRCWARGLAGSELRAALEDCNAALRASPTRGARGMVLDSRGLVRLRLGDFAGAIRDYDEALAIAADRATSLYGRGIAEMRQGRSEAGEADLHAATALRADVADPFRTAGINP